MLNVADHFIYGFPVDSIWVDTQNAYLCVYVGNIAGKHQATLCNVGIEPVIQAFCQNHFYTDYRDLVMESVLQARLRYSTKSMMYWVSHLAAGDSEWIPFPKPDTITDEGIPVSSYLINHLVGRKN